MQQLDEFFLCIKPLKYINKKNRCLFTETSVIDIFRRQELIPGELLSSRAHFRFSSILQSSKEETIFTTCLKSQPLTISSWNPISLLIVP